MAVTSLDMPEKPIFELTINENVNMVKLNTEKSLMAAALDAVHVPIFDTRTKNTQHVL